MRVAFALLSLPMLLLATIAGHAAPPAFFLMVSTQGQGTDELADQAARELRDLVGIELRAAFPCAQVGDDQDAVSKLNAAKARVDRDPTAATPEMGEVGDMLNRANYVGVFSATRVGGRLQLRSRVYKHPDLHRSVDNVSIADAEDPDQLVTALDQLAKLTARELATELGIRCPVSDWHGTVGLTRSYEQKIPGETFTFEYWSRQKVTCNITGSGTRLAQCSADWDLGRSAQTTSGRDASFDDRGSGTAMVDMTVEVADGRVHIHLPSFEVNRQGEASEQITGVEIREPASRDANAQSGSKSVEFIKSDDAVGRWTVTWNLKR